MTTTRELSAPEGLRFGLGIFFVSGCLTLLACYLAYGQWQLSRTGVLASGEVISLVGKNGRNPVVRFQAPNGETCTFTERNSSVFSPVHQGDYVEVIFPPGHPDEARLVITQWLGVKVIASIATMVGCFGMLILAASGWRVVRRF
jgi:hypothetical protein